MLEMNNNTIIFVGSPEKSCKGHTILESMKSLYVVSPYYIGLRIIASFMPPFGKALKKIYVDFLGPSLALLILTAILTYGQSYKKHTIAFTPVECLLCYCFVMPLLCYVLLKLSGSYINLSEVVSLLGYAMYGMIFTIATSFLFYNETSNAFFFLCLVVFGGFSTFRLAVVFLTTIPKPAARLLVCSLVAILQISMLMFVHFVYMHESFVYGKLPAKIK